MTEDTKQNATPEFDIERARELVKAYDGEEGTTVAEDDSAYELLGLAAREIEILRERDKVKTRGRNKRGSGC